jgi:hypothetical protein
MPAAVLLLRSCVFPATFAALAFLSPLVVAQPAPPAQNRPAPTNPPSPADNEPTGNAVLHEDARGRPAGDVLGREVVGANNARLGRLDDLVIDAVSGRILYGLVDSARPPRGLRAVPFDLLLPEIAGGDLRFILNTEEAAWERAPRLDKNQLGLLKGDGALRQDVHRHFSHQPPGAPKPDEQRLELATAIAGKNLRRGEETIGKIEGVVIHLETRAAGALFAPLGAFVETDAKFLLPLASLSPRDGTHAFTTTLNREDFVHAPASIDAMWAVSGSAFRSPYLWPAYGTTAVPPAGALATPPATVVRTPPPSPSLPSVEEINNALLSDPNTWSTRVRVVAGGNRLLLQGTVLTQDEKQRMENRVTQVAGAWPIENQLLIAGQTTR